MVLENSVHDPGRFDKQTESNNQIPVMPLLRLMFIFMLLFF